METVFTFTINTSSCYIGVVKYLKKCLKASCTRKILRKEIEKKTIKGKQPAIIAINHPFCKESVLFPTHHFN